MPEAQVWTHASVMSMQRATFTSGFKRPRRSAFSRIVSSLWLDTWRMLKRYSPRKVVIKPKPSYIENPSFIKLGVWFAREIVLSNGRVSVALDTQMAVRDFFYPNVG